MPGHDYLSYLLVFLLAAVIAVPLFRRLGLGAVLGYLAAGIVLGPDVLGFVRDPETALLISEFGVVLLLFIIGLELSPARLWIMRRAVFGVGGLQVGLSALAIGFALFQFDFGPRAAAVVAIGLALSSTAVGLQILAERKELGSTHGRAGFAILLVQDLVAIPLLAAIPLLGIYKAALETEEAVVGAIVRGIVAVLLVILLGRYVLHYLFRAVARVQAVEVFTAATLLVVAGTAWLMQQVGLSMGLGAFLAGVLLADSEFRHELESHIEPFKGLLLGLFFMAIGMTGDLDLIAERPLAVATGVGGLLAIKALVLFGLGRTLVRGSVRDALMLASVLAMGGEFAFVVFAEAFRAGLLYPDQRDLLVAVVGLSMAVTPLAILAVHRFVPAPERVSPRPFDMIGGETPRVIIAGFGRVGQIVARLLRAQHIPFIALENSPDQVETSRRFGTKIFYGDPARPELLRAARADQAEVFVVATDDPEANIRTARLVKRMYPHLKVYARARNRQHVFRLMDLNVDGVVRESFHSSLVLGRHVLRALGLPEDVVDERTERFRQHDEALLREQHLVYDDEAAVIASSKESLRDLERIFDADAFPHPGAMVARPPATKPDA
jgi:glutathione-regulated potassium-efflux system protein KefB